MTVRINTKLTNTRNPTEHGFKLENQEGYLIQVLGDGFNRVVFDQFQIKTQYKKNRKVIWKNVPLEWYIHDTDFTLTGE